MEEPDKQPEWLVDEAWDDGLRYTEEWIEPKRGFPSRRCALWAGDGDEPVSTLVLLGMRVRFGALALPVEGYAAVNTAPGQRRGGYMGRLLRRSLRSAEARVSVVCLYGIADFYPRYGFVTCQRAAGTGGYAEVRRAVRPAGDARAVQRRAWPAALDRGAGR